MESSEEFEDSYDLSAFILIEIINRHAFNDGNHRTAWIVAKQILRKNGEEMHVEETKSLDEIERDQKGEIILPTGGPRATLLHIQDGKKDKVKNFLDDELNARVLRTSKA